MCKTVEGASDPSRFKAAQTKADGLVNESSLRADVML